VNEHHAIGPELQQLATTILAVVDPLLQAGAAAFASAAEGAGPGKCAQVWCPFCAVAALASGEHHPLASIVAEHGTALLTVLRAAAQSDVRAPAEGAAQMDADVHRTGGRYSPIPVEIHD
jgi:hypothetical protein